MQEERHKMRRELVELKDIWKRFPIAGGVLGREVSAVHAVRGVSLSIAKGETLGLVGESGCGKSTLGMLALRLIDPDSGRVIFGGTDVTDLPERTMRPMRRRMQIVFQDPYASLNPRMRIGSIVGEPLIVHERLSKGELRSRVMELLSVVGLGEDAYGKYPHEFSGGQRQRIGIARAIALVPEFIVADEPVSALDISIRGEILNLLSELREKFSLTYLFVSHDLNVVEHISDRIAVMYLGKIVEMFPAAGLREARHPYTSALVSAIPIPDPGAVRKVAAIGGDVPSPIRPPSGCSFHPRCPFAKDACRETEPELKDCGGGFCAACHFISDMKPVGG
jgi:oligopeptide/dipeptide ABC transporter ATP-binding protein